MAGALLHDGRLAGGSAWRLAMPRRLEMVLNVACRDEELTPAARGWVRELSLRLERYFTEILTVDWDLTMDGIVHVATCRLHTTQGFYRAHGRAMDARQAMHAALHKLTKQRRREKKKADRGRRDPLVHELPDLGGLVAPRGAGALSVLRR